MVLAAGRGRRLGGAKALLNWSGAPLAQVHAAHWQGLCDRVLIVTRRDIAAALRRHAPGLQAELVVSTYDDALGPAGSLMAAALLIEDAANLLVTPVDCPPVAIATSQRLVDALDPPAVAASRPRHGPRRGHPVAMAPEAWRGYRAAATPLRDVLNALGTRAAEVVVNDAGVLRDIDEEKDLGAPPTFFELA